MWKTKIRQQILMKMTKKGGNQEIKYFKAKPKYMHTRMALNLEIFDRSLDIRI